LATLTRRFMRDTSAVLQMYCEPTIAERGSGTLKEVLVFAIRTRVTGNGVLPKRPHNPWEYPHIKLA
jgi:hypothetical protein